MPSYKITDRNSFEVNGRKFIVARVRYRDDGMEVMEHIKDGNYLKTIQGFWGCLLTPDYRPRRTVRDKARAMVEAFIECGEWMPTKEQIAEIESKQSETAFHTWWWNEKSYLHWFLYFNKPNPVSQNHVIANAIAYS